METEPTPPSPTGDAVNMKIVRKMERRASGLQRTRYTLHFVPNVRWTCSKHQRKCYTSDQQATRSHASIMWFGRLTLPVRSMLLLMVKAVRVGAAGREPASEAAVGALSFVQNIHTEGLCISLPGVWDRQDPSLSFSPFLCACTSFANAIDTQAAAGGGTQSCSLRSRASVYLREGKNLQKNHAFTCVRTKTRGGRPVEP